MKNFSLLLLISLLLSCSTNKSQLILSPDGRIKVEFGLNQHGKPFYRTTFNQKLVLDTSYIGGFEFKELSTFSDQFSIIRSESSSANETWDMPWGEQKTVVDNHNATTFYLKSADNQLLNITFKVFNDGFGFQYEIPRQNNLDSVLVLNEFSEFKLTDNHQVWWQPGDWDIYEHLYQRSRFSDIDATKYRNHPNLNATFIPENAVNTPVTLKSDEQYYLSFHEANLRDYTDMTLKVDASKLKFTSNLVGSENLNGKAVITLPYKTPWRTVQIASRAGDLIESKLILNLNEPNKLGDVSYFTPMKYLGIWWEMHIGKSTWDMEGSQDMSTYTLGGKTGKRHGATTENALRYIDFAADNGIKGLLIEGWNTGWDKWINTSDREGVFDFMTPYPDYDFDRVMAYARKKGVEVIMHHETSSAPRTYEKQMDLAFDFMKKHGMNAVKTGYVGKIIPSGEYHHGQWMVRHYQHVFEKAAQKQIAVNVHEPIKDTGIRRTYPNAISREGLRGQEFNAWASDGGNPPNHIPTVAFTRMLAGPIDYTPGVFNIKFDEYKKENQVNTTLAHQLALYVVIYSPIQMVCDLPEHYYENGKIHPMFQFIKEVGVDWQSTRVLDGEVGDFVIIARQEKESATWFVGGVTGEVERIETLTFDFLPKGKKYKATLYKDGPNAHWNDNPLDYTIETMSIEHNSSIKIRMAPGGGFAISLFPEQSMD
jgi:glucan 1,4-alpha-glucosidase